MKKEGTASFWIGIVESEDVVRRLLEYSVSEDGGFEGCHFSRLLNIKGYEPEFVEWYILPRVVSNIHLLFRKFSYSEIIFPQLQNRIQSCEANCAIGFYNIEFSGEQSNVDVEGGRFEFLGTVDYESKANVKGKYLL